MIEKMLVCTNCGVAFPEWDEEIVEDFKMKCPYCDGELKMVSSERGLNEK